MDRIPKLATLRYSVLAESKPEIFGFTDFISDLKIDLTGIEY